MTIIKKQVIDRFNQSAATYDSAADLQRSVAGDLASKLEGIRADSILEIGCGTGLLSQELVTLFPTADFLLTDIASQMIEHCQRRFSSQPRVKTLCVDGENLLLDSSFDLIVSSMTLQWFNQLENSFHRIKALLNPKGRFIFSLPGTHSLREWRDVCETFGVPVATPDFYSKEKLQEILPACDFRVVEYKQPHQTLFSFLQSLKKIGARAPRAGYDVLSPGKLRRLLKCFQKEVTMTYEIIYGVYQQ